MRRRANNLSRDEVRRALRTAASKVVSRLLSEEQQSQICAAGVAEVSRTTLRNLLDAGRKKEIPSAKFDTVADVLYGLNIPLAYFATLLLEQLSADASGWDPADTGTVEIRVGQRVFRGRLVQFDERKNDQKTGQDCKSS